MSTRKYSCPCGKGEYEEITKSDDWGNYRDDAVMLCPDCKGKYIWKEVNPSNRPSREFYTWMKKDLAEHE